MQRDVPLGHAEFGRAIPCRCALDESEEARLSRLQRYSSLGPLTRLTFENLIARGRSRNPRDQDQFRKVVTDARAFAEKPEGWMLIHGPSGAGKTHVSAAIANACIECGRPALFVVVPDLLDHLRSAYNPGHELGYDALFEHVRNAPVLILDDLGTQSATPWAEEKLFQILNHRYNARLPTVITTNLPLERMDERLRTRLTDLSLSAVYHVESNSTPAAIDLPNALDLGRIREMTLESFDTRVPHLTEEQRWSLENAYRAALAFADDPRDWLLLIGANGCGKTHLAAAIAHRRQGLGDAPVFVVVADLLDYLRHVMGPESHVSFFEAFERLRNAPLLVLDDLGAQSDVGWVRDRLFQLINHRYAARLPTVFTVSEASLDRLEERVLARLNDPNVCTEVPIIAPAFRADVGARSALPSRGGPGESSRRRAPTTGSPPGRTSAPRGSRDQGSGRR